MHYYRFGKHPHALAKEIVQWQPNMVLISSFAFCYALEAIEVAQHLRKLGYAAPIGFGGAGPSCYPEYYLKNSEADFVFQGEADEAFPYLLCDYTKTAGVWYKNHGNIVHIDSTIPQYIHPAIVMVRKAQNASYYSSIFTRGCPMKCGFCSSRLHMPTFRKATIEAADEVFKNTHWDKHSHLNIEDDAIVWDFDYLLEIIHYLKKYTDGDATFSLENGVDYRALDAEKITMLSKLGLSKLNISLVSSNANVLSQYCRSFSIEKFIEIVEAAHQCKIPTTAYIIAGLKGDTYNQIKEILHFLSTLPVLIGISPFYAIPKTYGFENTEIFDSVSPRLCAGTSFYPWNNLTTDELVALFCKARMINLQKNARNIDHHRTKHKWLA